MQVPTNAQGLRATDIAEINSVLAQHPEVKRAYIFGSRAKGTHRPYSDVDLALEGDTITNNLAWDIRYTLLEECYLPYTFDVVALAALTNQNLLQEIQANWVLIYEVG